MNFFITSNKILTLCAWKATMHVLLSRLELFSQKITPKTLVLGNYLADILYQLWFFFKQVQLTCQGFPAPPRALDKLLVKKELNKE